MKTFRKYLVIGLILTLAFAIMPAGTVSAADQCVNPGGTGGCLSSIQVAIDAASAGDTITVYNGTYPEALNIYKSLTINGESETGVIIDTHTFLDYGIDAAGDITTYFNNFTLIGPPPGAYGYGIKVSGENAQTSIQHVTVQNSGRSGIDLNGLDGLLVNDVTLTNNGGVGLALTDCSDITASNITTSGNAWAGMAIYTKGESYTGGSDNITLGGTNSFGETPKFYIEELNGFVVTDFEQSDFGFTVKNDTDAPGFITFFETQAEAIAAALVMPHPVESVITDLTSDSFLVVPGLSIQAAHDAADPGDTIIVADGTYNYDTEGQPADAGLIKIQKGITLKAQNDGNGIMPVIDASGAGGLTNDGVFKIHATQFSGGTVIIEGFDITGIRQTGIAITAAMYQNPINPNTIIIRNNKIHGMIGAIDFWGTITFVTPPDPDPANAVTSHIVIDNNQIYDMGVAGVKEGLGVMIEDPAAWTAAGSDYAAKITNNTFSIIVSKDAGTPGAAIVLPRADPATEELNVLIQDNTIDSTVVGVGVGITGGSGVDHLDIIENQILNTGVGVLNMIAETADASPNWWGQATGPLPTQISGDVDYVPWCTDATCSDVFGPVHNLTQDTWFATIQDAVTAAANGETIEVNGTYTLTGKVTINKDLTLTCDPAAVIQVSGTGPKIEMAAAGSSLEGCSIQSTDKADQQFFVDIMASNVTVQDNTMWGNWNVGDPEVSRAMRFYAGAFSGILIDGNEIHNLRQPGYISGTHTGMISNNYVHSTKGWVLEGGNLTFEDNTWSGNVGDIAILATVPASYYTDIVAMSLANNNAVIEDQRLSNPVLSVVYVDDSAAPGGNGTQALPLQTIQAGMNRVISGGTIYVAAGTYVENPATTTTMNKSINLIGEKDLVGDPLPVLQGTLTLNNSLMVESNLIENFVFQLVGTGSSVSLTQINGITFRNVDFLGTGTIAGVGIQMAGGANGTDDVVIDDCSFTNGYYVGVQGSVKDITVTDSVFSGVKSGINLQSGQSNLVVDKSSFSVVAQGAANDTYGIRLGSAAPVDSGKQLTITDSIFVVDKNGYVADSSTFHSAIIIRAGVNGVTSTIHNSTILGEVVNQAAVTLDATQNWWGQATGPAAGIVRPLSTGAILTCPWLGSEGGTASYPVNNTSRSTGFCTIQAAIDDAATVDGDTITVSPGTYLEKVVINKPNLTIRSTGGAASTIIDVPDGTLTTGVSIVGTNLGVITFDGFTVKNFTESGIVQGMASGTGTTVHVLNNIVIPRADYMRNGIQVSGDNSTVIGNTVASAPLTADWAGTAIHVVNASNVLVKNNTITGSANVGIGISNYNDILVSGITVEGNTVSGVSSAVSIQGGPDATGKIVSDVTIKSNNFSGAVVGIDVAYVTLAGANVIELNQLPVSDYYMAIWVEGYPSWGYPGSIVTGTIDFSPNWFGSTAGPNVEMFYDDNLTDAFTLASSMYAPWCGNPGCTILINPPVHNITQDRLYLTIQAAIDDADAEDVIQVAPGTYVEQVNLNKQVSIIGSGREGVDATIIRSNAYPTVLLGATGTSTSPILLQNLQIQGAGGIRTTVTPIDYFTLDNVWLNANPVKSGEGIRVVIGHQLTHLTITNSIIEGYIDGVIIEKTPGTGDAGTKLQYVTVTDTIFRNNYRKGLYVETLSDATFTNVQLIGNGYVNPGTNLAEYNSAGFDINLKDGAYSNLQFINMTATGNGLKAKDGAALMIKARSDGATYSVYPATLTGVTITGGTFTGNERGIRFGEPNKDNAGPTNVVITGASLLGNVKSYDGTDGSAYGDVVNYALAPVSAMGNWWGSATGPAAGQTYGNVMSCGWLDAAPPTGVAVATPVNNTTSGAGFCTIQAAIDAATAGDTITVAAGTYVEDPVIDKALTLLGPNAAINPNTGPRVAEAIILPAFSAPDPDVCEVMAYIKTSGVTIKGFTFDGDNPALNSGLMIGTADVDACEIIAGYEGMGNIVIENNILKHSTYSGIDFYNYRNDAATAGNYILNNLFQNIGESTYNWGIGILLYNNFYADVTGNVMEGVRTGIQTGNFYRANPGTTGSISNNTINAWRLGIFHNLWYSSASPITVSGNTINAIAHTGTTKWNGMLISSFSGAANTVVQDNIINIPDAIIFAAPGYTAGYNIWNDNTTSPLVISGGTVTGGDYGVFVNNYEGYTSNADNNTFVTIDKVTILGSNVAGIYVKDSPSNTNGTTVYASITANNIDTDGTGILIEGADATATAYHNDVVNNPTASITNLNTGVTMDADENWWGSVLGPQSPINGGVDVIKWCSKAWDEVAGTGCDPLLPQSGTTLTLTGTEELGQAKIYVPNLSIVLADGAEITNTGGPCFSVNADHTTIIAATKLGAVCTPAAGFNGIDVAAGLTDITIANLEFAGTAGTDGIHFAGVVDNLFIYDNWFHDLAGDAIDFGSYQPTGDVKIQGNLFEENTGMGIRASVAIPAEYNSWGHIDGALAGDGASGNVDWTPWTHVDLYITSPTGLVAGQPITFTVYGNLKNAMGAAITLKYPVGLVYSNATNLSTFQAAGSALFTTSTGAITFNGIAPVNSPISGVDMPLFSVTFFASTADGGLLNLDETTDLFSMVPLPAGPSTNIYALKLVDVVATTNTFAVKGTFYMQGHYENPLIPVDNRSGIPGTLTGIVNGLYRTQSVYSIPNNMVFTYIPAQSYIFTTLQPRYLNITADLGKEVTVSGADVIFAESLWLLGGNAIWTDNIIDISDASAVGLKYGIGTITDNADVTFDGKVDILDLSLVAGNFDKTSASAYADWDPQP